MSTGKESTKDQDALNNHIPDRGNWSAIPLAERDALIDALRAKCHSVQSLRKQGFWTQIPSQQDLDMKKRCRNCGEKEKKLRSAACRFHPAKKPSATAHDFALADPKLAHMQVSPKSNLNARKAVVLDCEMVGVLGPNNRQVSEAIRVSAVDFLTGDILIDTYIEPVESIIGLSSQYNGVNSGFFKDMKRREKTVCGWRAARELVWKIIDQQTILMGHALQNCLAVLGIVHANVVDSAIMTRDAVGWGCRRTWALRTLASDFLDRDIQTGYGHDCLEDTFAAREVILWCLQNTKELGKWAYCRREW